jgi:hypothetical protein
VQARYMRLVYEHHIEEDRKDEEVASIGV